MSRQPRVNRPRPFNGFLLSFLTGCIFAAGPALAQGLFPMGGRGLSSLNAAWVQDRGQFSIHAMTAAYYQTAKLPNQTGPNPEFTTYWDTQGGLATHYSFNRRMEVTLAQTLYQDTHRDAKGANIPDDLYFAAKFGSYGGLRSRMRWGFMTSARFPLAKHHNVILEPYSAGRMEFGLLGLMSYSKDVLIPENAFNAHLNFGFWHHNDTGRYLVGTKLDTFAVLDPSRALLWGAGMAIPSHQFDFTFEVFGRNFLKRPPVTAYSREDFAYFTPGVTYHPIHWASLNVAFDVRISPNHQSTQDLVGFGQVNAALPSYPSWRVRFGAASLESTAAAAGTEAAFRQRRRSLGADAQKSRETTERRKRKTETAEEELTQIRSERKRMEAMLTRLRNLLNYGKAEPAATAKPEEETIIKGESKEENDPPKEQ
jgi:hypothetical protein